MNTRQRIASGSPWEGEVGYSRAVRVGSRIYVSGTTATDEHGTVISPGDAYGQTRYIIEKIGRALAEAGASLEHVTRTRMFVTDISRWREYGRAHNEFFHDVRPATSMIEVKALIGPGLLIEIEVEAEW